MFATAADGTKLHYDAAPGPRPVLFLHGFATEHEATWVRTGWARAVADRGYLLTDLRGHGRSDRATTGYSAEGFARDVLSVLDDAGMASVDVVSYSMGGHVAWALARLAPQRVGRLVLGGIGDAPVSAAAMRSVREALSGDQPEACITGMAGTRLEGPAPAPALFAAGELDDLATGARSFATACGATFTSLGPRNHLNAISARTFKTTTLDFLTRTRHR